MKKIFLLLLVIIIIVVTSCFSRYKTENLTVEDIEILTSSNVEIEKSFISSVVSFFKTDKESPVRKLQYFVSSTVVYNWDSSNKEEIKLNISKDGKLKVSDVYKDKKFKIKKNTLGVLTEEPVKVNGKYVLSVDFNNIIIEFEEGLDGLFYLSTPTIEYEGYLFSTKDMCKLQYKYTEEKTSSTTSKSAKGRKIKN